MSNPAIISRLQFLEQVRSARWEAIGTYRDYADGDQELHLTDDQKILLVGKNDNGTPRSNPEFAINVCGIVLDSKVERLKVRGIKVTVPDPVVATTPTPEFTSPADDTAPPDATGDGEQTMSEQVSELVMEWWDACGLEENEENIYFAASRDGDAYTITEYDADAQRPDVVLNWTYAEVENADLTGTEMAYLDGHPNKRLYATKRWTLQRPAKHNTRFNRARRLNVYFDDHTEYYVSEGLISGSSESGWHPLPDTDADYDAAWFQSDIQLADRYNQAYTATVSWNTDTKAIGGMPLGFPVEHFRNNARGSEYGRSDIAPLVPGLQDAMNRTALSLDAATVLNGFKEAWTTGFFPDDDRSGQSRAIKRAPAAMHYFEDAAVATGQYGETNLEQLVSVLDNWVVKAATLTSTPLSLFNLTAHTPAEGTQKQLESALLARVNRAQRSFGASWARVVRYMLKLEAVYGSRLPGVTVQAIDQWDIDIDWEPAETRNETEERQIAVTDVQQLQVPVEYVWPRFFPPEQVAEMKQAQEAKRNLVIGQAMQQLRALEAGNAALATANGNGATADGINGGPDQRNGNRSP